jgi:hypothetical protein
VRPEARRLGDLARGGRTGEQQRPHYVIIAFHVGGVDAFRDDVEIPRRYGLDQTVGDTLGPGGVSRFLRSAVAYNQIAADLAVVAPDAQAINYANPMAMATGVDHDRGLGATDPADRAARASSAAS